MAVEKMKELKEIWENDIYRETLTMIPEEDGRLPELLYLPAGEVVVESYDGKIIYEPGKDYVFDGRFIRLPEGSGIPTGTRNDLYYATRRQAQQELTDMPYELGFGPVSTADGKYITLKGIDHPEYLTKWQICVSYQTKEEWWGKKPKSKQRLLPEFAGKCEKGGTVRILIFGDSISCGYDCSGFHHQEPGQPIWPEIVAQGLEKRYHCRVEMDNVSKAGEGTAWAAEHAGGLIGKKSYDLVILGFGMNDREQGNIFQENIKKLIRQVRSCVGETEFLLIATTLPNPETTTPPIHFTAYQYEYAEVLLALEEKGIAVADVQTVQKELQKRKRYLDITGNWLNHPNDFLARIQAQVVFRSLT